MAHLDFSKVEQTLGMALHQIFVKTLVEGEVINYARAISFFGNEEAKPIPHDSVVEAMVEIQKDIDEIELTLPAFLPAIETAHPVEPSLEFKIPPVALLRKRILWLIKKNVANIYSKIGSSKEEMSQLRSKSELTLEEIRRVHDLLKNTHELALKIKKSLGIETDEGLVEKEKKKHLTKRLNVRDSWLTL
jgi:hypothetical protein